MFGWFRADAALASCTKRRLRSASVTFLRRQNLYCNEPVQVRIAGFVHYDHAAAAERFDDFVMQEGFFNATYFAKQSWGVQRCWVWRPQFSLDKTKGMVYVLMSENTQSVGFVWPIWQSSSAGIFRLTASAPELACSGYRLTGSCGLVDDVAAAGRPREFGNGGQQVVQGALGDLVPPEKRVVEKRVSSHTGALSRARTRLPLEAAEAVCDQVFATLIQSAQAGPAVAVVSGGWLLDAPAAHASLREGLSARWQSAWEAHWPVIRVLTAHHWSSGLAVRPCWGPMFGAKR